MSKQTNKQQLPFSVPPEPKQQAYAVFTPCHNHNYETFVEGVALETLL